MIKATKSVLIVRISDKGQDDGMSPEQQIELGENYSKSHKLIPIKTFSFIESSYKGEREQFYVALKFVKEQIEPIAIVIKCVDRLQRRFDETKELENLIERGKIELHFISEGLIINQNSPASDYTRWDLGVIFGRNSSKTTSEKVKKSADYRREHGISLGNVPNGYLNSRGENGKSTVIADENKRYLINEMFTLYANGNYSISELAIVMKKKGLRSKKRPYGPISTANIHCMLNNPFYHGIIFYKRSNEYKEHFYERIITKELFNRCQEIMHKKNKKTYKSEKSEHNYNGLIKCACCKSGISTDFQKKKNLKYLFCDKSTFKSHTSTVKKCDSIRVKEENISQQFISKIFSKIYFDKETLLLLKDRLKSSSKEADKYYEIALKKITNEINTIKNNQKSLTTKFIEESITKDDYDSFGYEYIQRLHELQLEEKNLLLKDERFEITVSTLLKLISKIPYLFESSKPHERKAFIQLVVSNITLNKGNLEWEYKKPFDILASQEYHTTWWAV